MDIGGDTMIVRFQDGRTVEGILLANSHQTIRVALRGAEDVTLFRKVNEVWVSDDCEPVTIRFEVECIAQAQAPTEDQCICSKELAAQLVQSLAAGDSPAEPGFANLSRAVAASSRPVHRLA
jgi:hypothetical protein